MNDGFKLEYNRGIISAKIEFRTDEITKHEKQAMEQFIEFCNKVWEFEGDSEDYLVVEDE